MKRKIIWLVVALLTFVIGVATAMIWLNFPNLRGVKQDNANTKNIASTTPTEPEVPFVSICELARNPQNYNQKVIRTKAILSVGTDTATLMAYECEDKDSHIWAECFNPPAKTCEVITTAIDKFLGKEKGRWIPGPTIIDVVGKFFESDEHGYKHQLEMLEIKDAKLLENSVR